MRLAFWRDEWRPRQQCGIARVHRNGCRAAGSIEGRLLALHVGEFVIHRHFLDVFGEDCRNSQVSGVASLKDEKRQGSFGAKDHEFSSGHVELEVPVGHTCREVQVGG